VKYRSTRSQNSQYSFKQAVLLGLAPDGGLIVPHTIPKVTDLDALRALDFERLSSHIFSLYCDDIPSKAIADLVHQSYQAENYLGPVCPTVTLDAAQNLHVMELFHGPTLAFKDVALQLLGRVFNYILTEQDLELNILAATSGDTGSAAICGLLPCSRITSFVMHPLGRIAPLQEIQMTSVVHRRVHNLAIEGNFDDCQGHLKALLGENLTNAAGQTVRLGAVNSVNWCRIMAQMFYYAWCSLRFDSPIDVVVPTGNFGNVLAAYYVEQMGFPIGEITVATNENNILKVFFETGSYSKKDPHYTLAPAMDIQVASNFERYLFHRSGDDAERTAERFRQFQRSGEINFFSSPPDFLTGDANDAEILETIASVFQRWNYLADPHTAVALKVAIEQLASRKRTNPLVVVATAHPAKFPEAIQKSCGQIPTHPILQALEGSPTRKIELPNQIDVIRDYLLEHAQGSPNRAHGPAKPSSSPSDLDSQERSPELS
jgi:threonine synthase